MEEEGTDLAPWEVPPDEAYWQELLREGEYGEGSTEPAAEEEESPVSDVPKLQEDMALYESQSTAEPIDAEAKCWDTFLKCQADDTTVDLQVVGFNRGGLLVKWNDVVGFVPASQLCEGLPYEDEQSRLDALSARVNDVLTLKVIEVDPLQSRLILSERASRRVQEPDLTVLETLRPGDVCRGAVTNLCTFGAFVDLGGAEGLIHISELSWGRVSHPADVLQSGQEVDVFVLNVDRERGRVGLSLKRMQPDPWAHVESNYGVGQVVKGTVTNIVNFGIFVRIEEGLEGLIHTSELKEDASPPQYIVQVEDAVLVRIVSIDKVRHRMGLSLERVVDTH